MLIGLNWRPNTWRVYKRTAYTAHNTREEIYEGGADAMYPFALEKGRAEGSAELLDELKAKDTTIYLSVGCGIDSMMEHGAISWHAKKPGWLVFIPEH